MRNVYSLFDDETLPTGVEVGIPVAITRRADPRDVADRKLTCAAFTRHGQELRLYWYSNERPSNRLEFDRVTLKVSAVLGNPVWVDMITGRIGVIDPANVKLDKGTTTLTDVPMWDSPVLVANRTAVPFLNETLKPNKE